MWVYKSPIGLLKIVKLKDTFYFMFGDDPTLWTGCKNPIMVANEIYYHITGCDEWDFSDVIGPTDWSEWKIINTAYFYRRQKHTLPRSLHPLDPHLKLLQILYSQVPRLICPTARHLPSIQHSQIQKPLSDFWYLCYPFLTGSCQSQVREKGVYL